MIKAKKKERKKEKKIILYTDMNMYFNSISVQYKFVMAVVTDMIGEVTVCWVFYSLTTVLVLLHLNQSLYNFWYKLISSVSRLFQIVVISWSKSNLTGWKKIKSYFIILTLNNSKKKKFLTIVTMPIFKKLCIHCTSFNFN